MESDKMEQRTTGRHARREGGWREVRREKEKGETFWKYQQIEFKGERRADF